MTNSPHPPPRSAPTPGDPVRLVADSYDAVAERYAAARRERTGGLRRLLDTLAERLSPGASALDVGCGSGVPVARFLVDHGFFVTGLDVSTRLLDIARRQVPEATYVHGDMRTARPEGAFDAIVAWDSVFHLPRADHAAMFERFASWLRPAGLLLLSLGGSAWEGTSEMLGRTFFYGGHDPEEALALLRRAGFDVLAAEEDDPSSRGHVAVLAAVRDGKA